MMEGQSVVEESLLSRFVEYALHLINVKMEPFFNEHLSKFDFEEEEKSNKGQLDAEHSYSLEQYDVFKKFEKVLADELDVFMEKEGFSDAAECVQKIKELAAEDKARAEKQVKEMMEQLDTFMKSLLGQMEQGEGSEQEEQKQEIPTMLFYQPPNLDSLLETVLNLTEYETFAQMMRLRAGQQKMMAQLAVMFQSLTEQMGALELASNELGEIDDTFADGESTARQGPDDEPVNENDVEVENIEDDEEEVI